MLAVQAGCRPRPDTAQSPPTTAQAVSTDLHAAALEGDVATVEQHIREGSALNQKDSYGSTPLTIAITFGNVEVARALIEGGADLASTNRQGSSPLHLAAFFGHPELVQTLLEHGANTQARNDTGSTAFDIVAAPFDVDRPIYDRIGAGLKPLGLTLDYARIAATRPEIEAILKPSPDSLATAEFAPKPGLGWEVSTPDAEGLDPALLQTLYLDASAMEKTYSVVVVKNGKLIGERYFNGAALEKQTPLQSVTKSYTSALLGIALEQGCLTSPDQKLLEFFPELAAQMSDPRKELVTVRHLLQMRGGYPWEETDPKYWQHLLNGYLVKSLVDFPLVNAPGEAFNYSNISSHTLGVIIARACKTDLKSFAEKNLLGPLGSKLGTWVKDRDGYYVGLAEMQLTARDLAKFGLLYLNGGHADGQHLIPESWVNESLQSYSDDAWVATPPQHHVGRYFRQLGYGYQWWSAHIAEREVDFAWGHGGQLIVLLPKLSMVVVTTSDPMYRKHDADAWRHEQANINLIGKFVRSLPSTSP